MTARVPQQARYYGPAPCSLANTLMIVGERWTFLVLREAMAGSTRFGEFRSTLGIAAEVLSTRLSTLVESGVMVRHRYREPGQRVRDSYHLTQAGRDLIVVLGALQEWGDRHSPSAADSSFVFTAGDGRPVSAAFVDADGAVVPGDEAQVRRTARHPLAQPRAEAAMSSRGVPEATASAESVRTAGPDSP